MWKTLFTIFRKTIGQNVINEFAAVFKTDNITKLLKGFLRNPKKLGDALSKMSEKDLDKLAKLVQDAQNAKRQVDMKELEKLEQAIVKEVDPVQRNNLKKRIGKIRQEIGTGEVRVKVSSSWIQAIEWKRIGTTNMGLPTITVLSTGKSYDFYIPMSERMYDAITIGAHAGTKFHAMYWKRIGYRKTATAQKEFVKQRILRRLT